MTGTINRESYANTIFDKTITSTARSTACAFGDKSDYVIETSENAAYNAPYASKSASMESLGSISDQDVRDSLLIYLPKMFLLIIYIGFDAGISGPYAGS